MFKIKVGMLVSYDYKYIYNSLPLIYPQADKIILAIDKKRLTWSGIPFSIDNSFFVWVKDIDIDNKITIYEDGFYMPELSTAECDTRERNMLASRLGEGGWHIQVDSDEYFINFKGFVEHLRTLEHRAQKNALHIFTNFVTLFKQTNNGFIFVDGRYERIATATNYPKYTYIRNVKGIEQVNSNFVVLHQSWARDAEEMEIKTKSWGHSTDFNIKSYIKLWKAIDCNNYQYLKDFHPLTPHFWPKLSFANTTDILLLVDFFKKRQNNKTMGNNSFTKRIARNFLPPILTKK